MTFVYSNPKPTRCKAGVMKGYHDFQCSRRIWKDGWCKQHHPDNVKERDEKRRMVYKERVDNTPLAKAIHRVNVLESEKADLITALKNLVEGVDTMCKRDLKTEPRGEFYDRAKEVIKEMERV